MTNNRNNEPDRKFKAWVRTQEGVLELELHIRALATFMERNRTAATNPARIADLEASSKLLQQLLRKITEIERGIGGPQLAELNAELKRLRQANEHFLAIFEVGALRFLPIAVDRPFACISRLP